MANSKVTFPKAWLAITQKKSWHTKIKKKILGILDKSGPSVSNVTLCVVANQAFEKVTFELAN